MRPRSGELIQARGVVKSYKLGAVTIRALGGVDLDVAKGEMMAITGVSGSGKSTLLNLIGGMDRPDSGSIEVDGENIASFSNSRLTSFRATRIGFIFQNFNLISVLNVYDNIVVPMKLKGQRFEKAKVLELIERVGLTRYAKHRPDELSGGQRQRVAIARSLVHNPPYILADEITANLDTSTAMSIIALLKELNRDFGVTIVFASHDQRILDSIDRRVVLEDGVLVR
jgi:putative ABC transport system ATP-binding protein